MISKCQALSVGVLLVGLCACDNDVKLTGSTRSMETPAGSDAQGKNTNQTSAPNAPEIESNAQQSEPAPGAKSTTHTITHEREQVTETFAYPTVARLSQRWENPSEPLVIKSFQWQVASPVQVTATVPRAEARVIAGTKVAPVRHSDTSTSDMVVYAVVDTTENFRDYAQLKNRAKAALRTIVDDLYGYNLKIVVCGLEDRTPNKVERRIVNKGSKDRATLLAAVESAADQILATSGSGVEKLFRSASLCTENLPSSELVANGAVRVFTLITNAPNCKDSDHNTPECDRSSVNQRDHHLNLWDGSNGLGVNRHLSVMTALYRKTIGDCEGGDPVENPALDGESYLLNSQYAASIDRNLNILYPSGGSPVLGAAALTADICAADYGIDAMHKAAMVAKDLRDHRVKLTASYDTFPADADYDLKIFADGVLASGVVRDAAVAVSDVAGVISAVSHKQNGYRTFLFPGIMQPKADNQLPVTVKWNNGASTMFCVEAQSFAGLTPDKKCRYSVSTYDFEVRDLSFLPATDPVNVKTVSYTINYTSAVPQMNTLTFTHTHPIIPDTFMAVSEPAGANRPVLSASFSADGKTVVLGFGNDFLPTGDYKFKFQFNDWQTFSHGVNLAPGSNSVVCFAPNAQATLENGVIKIAPASSVIPCQYSSSTVSLNGSGTVDMRPFNVALKAAVAPMDSVTLDKDPDDASVTVKITQHDTGVSRSDADSGFTRDGRTLKLNKALAPGEDLIVRYTRSPELPPLVQDLAFAAIDGKYKVTLGEKSSPVELKPSIDFEVTVNEAGIASIALKKAGTYGDVLVVEYNRLLKDTDTTVENP